MKHLAWRAVDRHALAELLGTSAQVSAQAVGDATVYRLAADGGELLAVALADGHAVLIEPAASPAPRRRRRADA